MDPKNDFESLVDRAADGDEDASVEIWNLYYERLVRYARAKMRGMPRRAADEEDVALSAMNSFFGAARDGRLAPKDAGELWKLLATITVRKATGQLRKHHSRKRGGGRVRGNSALDAASEPASVSLDGLTPYLGVACEELLAQLQDDSLRQIAMMRLAGHRNDEIAAHVGCSVATVKRRLAEIRDLWSETSAGDPADPKNSGEA